MHACARSMHVRQNGQENLIPFPFCLQADVRAPDGDVPAWLLSADCEALAWSPAAPTQFLASSEDGLVAAYDARAGAGAAPLWRLAAHDKPACALAFSAAAPGMLATASTDKKVRMEAGMRRGAQQDCLHAEVKLLASNCAFHRQPRALNPAGASPASGSHPGTLGQARRQYSC